MAIQCKVAKILSDRELVINAGSENGVEEGMKFHVMGDCEVKDPDSEEIIDELPFVKVSLRVALVRPKVSVVKTSDGGYRRNPFSISDALLGPYTPAERFDYDERLIGEEVQDKTIYVGDLVVQDENERTHKEGVRNE